MGPFFSGGSTYFWQVTATSTSTTYPDEVQSSVGTFSTEGSLPTISAHPQSQTVEEEQSVTFSVTAGGFGTISYQWREDESVISGATSDSYTISSVTTDMSGNSYDCVVSNDVGSTTSNAATLTVSEIPYHTVSFWTEDGTPKPNDTLVKHGTMVQRPSADPQRGGYVFTDWYIEGASSAFNFTGTQITDNLQLVAGWKKVYSVTYHKRNDESGSAPTDPTKYESYAYATVASNSGHLQKNGYEFIGWTISEDGSGMVYANPNSIQIGLSDIHLYAKWEEIRYNIFYSMMGGMGTHSNPNSYSPLEVVTFTEASRNGYFFDGWYTSEEYITKIESTQGLAQDLILYGRWIVASGTVAYEDGIIDSGTNNFTFQYGQSMGWTDYEIFVDGHDASSAGYDVVCTTSTGCVPEIRTLDGHYNFKCLCI